MLKLLLILFALNAEKFSVEKVSESLVSLYEKHFDSSRQPAKQHSLDEIIIAENGPLLHHTNEMLERAINQYWRVANRDGKWHFSFIYRKLQ